MLSRYKTLIDIVIFVVLVAGWFSYAGWPVLVIAAGMLLLLWVHHMLRDAEGLSDDEIMDAINAAWSIGDRGPNHALHLPTSDCRGILQCLRDHGLDVVRIDPPPMPADEYPQQQLERRRWANNGPND